MPLTTRPPTIVFRSLLSPPIRIRLHTLHAFTRPQCKPATERVAATCLSQRRPLHLYHTAKAKTALGMQKILEFSLYEPRAPSASWHRVNLVKDEWDLTPLVKNISLQELYDNHIRPGKMLYMAQTITKKLSEDFEKLRHNNVPAHVKNYAIVDAHSIVKIDLAASQKARKQLGALKGVHIMLSNPVEYVRLALDRAYQFIEQGSPVEFRIRMLGSVPKKKRNSVPGCPEAWPWMHAHFPHLRPDFILKSMPEESQYIVKPVSDGRTLQFVVGRAAARMPKLDLTTRVFRVKKAVTETQGMSSNAQRKAVERMDRDLTAESQRQESTKQQDGAVKKVPGLQQWTFDGQGKGEKELLQVSERENVEVIIDRAVTEIDPKVVQKKMTAVKRSMRQWRAAWDRHSGTTRTNMWGTGKPNSWSKGGKMPLKLFLKKREQQKRVEELALLDPLGRGYGKP